MDYWFTGQKELKNIDVIPSSVQSMEDTFAECTALKTGPDWSRCESLTNLKGTLSKDTSLTYVYPIPSGVTVLDEICNGCTSLEVAPDMSGAAGVLYMQASFAGCVSLYGVSLPINVQNLSNTFSGCLNLETAPEIPATVVSMNNTFKKCSALKHASKIPSRVTDFQYLCRMSEAVWHIGNRCEPRKIQWISFQSRSFSILESDRSFTGIRFTGTDKR